jgi:type VI secretion system protein ImpK
VTHGATGDAFASGQRDEGPDAVARNILNQLLIAKATSLAREGRYAEAENLLDPESSNPVVLDLLARIKAQEGRLNEAEDLWRKALELDPGNDACRAVLKRISSLSLNAWALYGPSIAMGLLIAVAILITGITVSVYMKGQSSSSAVPAVSSPDAVVGSISAVEIKGVSARHENGQLLLTVDQVLFGRDERLTPSARLLLTRLARHLEPYAAGISIKITGTADGRRHKTESGRMGETSAGMARALKVAEHMGNTGSLPPDIFEINGAVDGQARSGISLTIAGRR